MRSIKGCSFDINTSWLLRPGRKKQQSCGQLETEVNCTTQKPAIFIRLGVSCTDKVFDIQCL